jgi:hypothetical protein
MVMAHESLLKVARSVPSEDSWHELMFIRLEGNTAMGLRDSCWDMTKTCSTILTMHHQMASQLWGG